VESSHPAQSAQPPGGHGTRTTVSVLCLVQFMDVLGVTVVLTALPKMLADVGAPPGGATLVSASFAMFFGGLLMFGARLGDRLGYRRCILGSLVAFAGGSLLAAVAASLPVLAAARCVQGGAAAIAVPSALRLLTAVATSDEARARAVAAWSGTGAVAGVSGFVLGGLVAGMGSWRFIFWGLLGVAAALAAAVVAVLAPDRLSRDRQVMNLPGTALLTVTVMLVVVAAALLGERPYRAAGVLLAAAAVPAGASFVVADRRSAAPLLPHAVLRLPQVWRGSTGAFVNNATTGSVATLISLYLQGTLGWSPLQTAGAFVPLSVLVVGGSAAAGRLIARFPREQVTAAGLAVISVGTAAPLLHPASVFLLAPGLALAGFGLGLSSVATTSLATDVPERPRATASGIVNTSAQLGTAIGTAAILLVAAATTGVPGRATPTPYAAWGAAAALALLMAISFAHARERPERRAGPRGAAGAGS
jgi:MFS family permease